jgi:hypothetical protein
MLLDRWAQADTSTQLSPTIPSVESLQARRRMMHDAYCFWLASNGCRCRIAGLVRALRLAG